MLPQRCVVVTKLTCFLKTAIVPYLRIVAQPLVTRHGFLVARNAFLVARKGVCMARTAVLQARNPFLGMRNGLLAKINVSIMVITTILATCLPDQK
jgi:hypothetical protein